jgi:hypothetical protein
MIITEIKITINRNIYEIRSSYEFGISAIKEAIDKIVEKEKELKLLEE